MKSKGQEILISEIVKHETLQMRAGGTDESHVEGMRKVLQNRHQLPPVDIMEVEIHGEIKRFLTDGYSRTAAYEAEGRTKIKANIVKGSWFDAVLAAAAANDHPNAPLKRSIKDRELAITHILEEADLCKVRISARKIAELTGSTHPTVMTIKRRLFPDAEEGDEKEPKKTKPSQSEMAQAEPEEPVQDAPQEGAVDTPPVEDMAIGGQEPAPQVDMQGVPIQPHAAVPFAALPEFEALLTLLRQAQRKFAEIAETPGGYFLTRASVSKWVGKRGEERCVHPGIEAALQQIADCRPSLTFCPYSYIDDAETKHKLTGKDRCPTCDGLNWTPRLDDKSIPKIPLMRAKKALCGDSEQQQEK